MTYISTQDSGDAVQSLMSGSLFNFVNDDKKNSKHEVSCNVASRPAQRVKISEVSTPGFESSKDGDIELLPSGDVVINELAHNTSDALNNNEGGYDKLKIFEHVSAPENQKNNLVDVSNCQGDVLLPLPIDDNPNTVLSEQEGLDPLNLQQEIIQNGLQNIIAQISDVKGYTNNPKRYKSDGRIFQDEFSAQVNNGLTISCEGSNFYGRNSIINGSLNIINVSDEHKLFDDSDATPFCSTASAANIATSNSEVFGKNVSLTYGKNCDLTGNFKSPDSIVNVANRVQTEAVFPNGHTESQASARRDTSEIYSNTIYEKVNSSQEPNSLAKMKNPDKGGRPKVISDIVSRMPLENNGSPNVLIGGNVNVTAETKLPSDSSKGSPMYSDPIFKACESGNNPLNQIRNNRPSEAVELAIASEEEIPSPWIDVMALASAPSLRTESWSEFNAFPTAVHSLVDLAGPEPYPLELQVELPGTGSLVPGINVSESIEEVGSIAGADESLSQMKVDRNILQEITANADICRCVECKCDHLKNCQNCFPAVPMEKNEKVDMPHLTSVENLDGFTGFETGKDVDYTKELSYPSTTAATNEESTLVTGDFNRYENTFEAVESGEEIKDCTCGCIYQSMESEFMDITGMENFINKKSCECIVLENGKKFCDTIIEIENIITNKSFPQGSDSIIPNIVSKKNSDDNENDSASDSCAKETNKKSTASGCNCGSGSRTNAKENSRCRCGDDCNNCQKKSPSEENATLDNKKSSCRCSGESNVGCCEKNNEGKSTLSAKIDCFDKKNEPKSSCCCRDNSGFDSTIINSKLDTSASKKPGEPGSALPGSCQTELFFSVESSERKNIHVNECGNKIEYPDQKNKRNASNENSEKLRNNASYSEKAELTYANQELPKSCKNGKTITSLTSLEDCQKNSLAKTIEDDFTACLGSDCSCDNEVGGCRSCCVIVCLKTLQQLQRVFNQNCCKEKAPGDQGIALPVAMMKKLTGKE